MSDSKPVSMPPHLWEALEQMSQEMGVNTDGLVAQAVFTLARLNGFVVPGKAGAASGAAAPEPAPSRAKPPPARPAPSRRPEPEPAPEPEPEPDPAGNFEGQDDGYLPEGEDYQQEEAEPEPPPPAPPPKAGRASLTLIVAGRDPFKMATDAFTIGRGKTCDFVIESNRVSREHCRILREGPDFTLEDLNSSNGTFVQPGGEKLAPGKKVKLKDGDEFKLGTEKIKFQIRK